MPGRPPRRPVNAQEAAMEGQRKAGKPSRFDARVADDIVDLAAQGATIKAIASTVGIGERTLHEWLERGAAGDPTFASWARRVRAWIWLRRMERREERYLREEAAAKE